MSVLIRPLITEKLSRIQEQDGKYALIQTGATNPR